MANGRDGKRRFTSETPEEASPKRKTYQDRLREVALKRLDHGTARALEDKRSIDYDWACKRLAAEMAALDRAGLVRKDPPVPKHKGDSATGKADRSEVAHKVPGAQRTVKRRHR